MLNALVVRTVAVCPLCSLRDSCAKQVCTGGIHMTAAVSHKRTDVCVSVSVVVVVVVHTVWHRSCGLAGGFVTDRVLSLTGICTGVVCWLVLLFSVGAHAAMTTLTACGSASLHFHTYYNN